MNYPISDKMASLKPSAIREIFKYAADPSVISLAGGNPAPESLPVTVIERMMREIFVETPMLPLLYSQSEGHPPLRDALKAYLTPAKIFGDNDELMVVSGAQQAMDLATKVLCNEGDTVICEDPSFIGSLNTFRSYNVNLVGVPLEADGICLEKLEDALKREKKVRFIYLIPNFQNPTGITMSEEKRHAVYSLAKKYSVLILEDNPYGDLRFEGKALPTIKSLDTDGLVIYAGTFSKILASGIRVGYIVSPKGIFDRLVVAKQCTDVHTSMIAQLLCHRFLTECDIGEHIKNIAPIYQRKSDIMQQELAKAKPSVIKYNRPLGGLFIWVELKDVADSADICIRLVKEQKVCVVPGSAFSVDESKPTGALRLNFSTPTDQNLVEGTRRFVDFINSIY